MAASETLDTEVPVYPITAPGISPPGPDFVRVAAALAGVDLADKKSKKKDTELSAELTTRITDLYREALYDPEFRMEVLVKGKPTMAQFLPGNIWKFHADGPRQSDVMLIGKNPTVEDMQQRRNLVGSTSEALVRAFYDLDIPPEVFESWYATNVCKHQKLDPASSTIAQAWLKNCIPLLEQEIKLVRPKFICCFGAESAKALLRDSALNMGDYFGHCLNYKYEVAGGEVLEAKLMVVTNPSAVSHNPDAYEDFLTGFMFFWDVVNGVDINVAESGLDHRVVTNVEQLNAVVDELIAGGFTRFAVDAEWHGDKPFEDNAYLRCIQVSWKAKCSFLVDLHGPGGLPVFGPTPAAAVDPLRRLLKSTPERQTSVGGHFFRADLPWLLHMGLDLRPEYGPPVHTADEYGWQRAAAGVGGFDTGLMLHAVNEVGPFNLEHNATRLCRVPRYDIALERWKIAYCRKHNLKPKQLEGYGECPSEILHPYGNYDADATFRIYNALAGDAATDGLLDCDRFGNDSWEAYWRNHRASLGVLEMEAAGIVVDMGRAEALVENYATTTAEKVAALRAEIAWPDFNHKSVAHCRELLFGEKLNGVVNKEEPGVPKRVRPPGALSFEITPVKASGKGGKEWDELVARGESHKYSPSTDRESLGILANTTTGAAESVVRKLRDIRFLGQILQSALRMPTTDATGEVVRDEDGDAMFDAGLLAHVNYDGRVRARIRQTLETGRAATSNPNLQNISKRREADYKRILGDRYLFPIRSILRASPGCVLVEADIKSAELAGMAWLAGDEQMTEDVRRNCLPENHPDYFEIHSNTAVQAFRLNCPPTKKGLESVNAIHLRVGAKNVNFGIPYGRGSAAICRQCKEEGVIVTLEEADSLREYYFRRYPATEIFLAECRRRSQDPGWLRGVFGRSRRFVQTSDRKIRGEQERQACNFPIQNMVADAVWEMIYQLTAYRDQVKLPFKLALQIHDAILFEVPVQHVEDLIHDVIPTCMSKRVPIYPCALDGQPRDDGPYYFGIDTEIYTHWGIKLKPAELEELGVPASVCEH